MSRVTLLTGGNEGDVEAALRKARAMVGRGVGRVVFSSSVRPSPPWGTFDTPQKDFLNQVLVVETSLEPLEVLDAVQEIERALGRGERISERGGAVRWPISSPPPHSGELPSRCSVVLARRLTSTRPDRQPDPSLTLGMTEDEGRVYSARPIDIDILYYDDVRIDTPRLTIPHPRIGEREFVKVLLEELPEWARR